VWWCFIYMLVEVTTSISKQELAVLQCRDEKERKKIIKSLFNSLEELEAQKLFKDFCTTFTRETYNWHSANVDFIEYESSLKGKLTVSFSGIEENGCRAKDKHQDYSQVVIFEISPLKKQIRFETNPPEIFERPPDEF